MSDGTLSGLRIVDMSFGIPGPVASPLPAEAGVDVVKVEPPRGDPLRETTPGFLTWNRSKRAVVLDLRDAADRRALSDLLEGADALIHGLRPSVARRHGLDDATLGERFPALITSCVIGYPIDGRRAARLRGARHRAHRPDGRAEGASRRPHLLSAADRELVRRPSGRDRPAAQTPEGLDITSQPGPHPETGLVRPILD